MALIECKNLTLGYEGTPVVENINFTVEEGDYLCIVGENGSGKTTLMKALLGLQKPYEGTIEMQNLKGKIGYLPQQTQVQRDFPASVREIVISGRQNAQKFKPFYTKEDKQVAKKVMEMLGIKPIENKSYRDLSGGQQQRVLLSRALCATQKALILDEPVSGLDPEATENMYGIIKRLNDSGTTIIMVTHDIDAAALYANKILHIGDEIVFATKEEYIKRKNKV